MKQELTTSKEIVEEEQRYKREGKGRILAISRRIYRLQNTDVFYVESESSDNSYYFVKFKPDVIEWCTCPDNSMSGGGGVQMKCKHLHAIEFAIRLGTLKDTDKLPTDSKVRKVVITPIPPVEAVPTKSSFINDEYSF